MAKVNGLRQKLKVLKSITEWPGDLCVSVSVKNQCMRPLKRHRELIRDVLKSELLRPVVLLDLLLTSCSFVLNNMLESHEDKAENAVLA